MKYLNFRRSGSKLESITCKFTKNRTPSQLFLKEFTISAEGCFWGQIYFGNIPEWLLFKDSCNKYIYFKISKLRIFYISYFDVMLKEGRMFMDFF